MLWQPAGQSKIGSEDPAGHCVPGTVSLLGLACAPSSNAQHAVSKLMCTASLSKAPELPLHCSVCLYCEGGALSSSSWQLQVVPELVVHLEMSLKSVSWQLAPDI